MVVKIYTTKTCPWCKKTKEFMKEKNIKYKEFDVGNDEKARNQMIEKSGQMGVPVVEIGDQIIVGFNPDAITKALGKDKEGKKKSAKKPAKKTAKKKK